MKRFNIYALSSVLLVMGGAGAASAQSAPVGISLRGGVFFPTSSNTSSLVGSTWVAFGAEYKLVNLDQGSEYHPHLAISIDYFSRDALSETPILLNYVVRKDSVFGSVGAGVSFDHVPGDSSTHFGYQVGIGYDLPVGAPVFVEAKFWGNDKSDYDGVGVYAGIRF